MAFNESLKSRVSFRSEHSKSSFAPRQNVLSQSERRQTPEVVSHAPLRVILRSRPDVVAEWSHEEVAWCMAKLSRSETMCDVVGLRSDPGLSHRPELSAFHTSHPGLCMILRRHPAWRQVSAALYGNNKKRSAKSLAKRKGPGRNIGSGYGGHFRAIQGFRYIGEPHA